MDDDANEDAEVGDDGAFNVDSAKIGNASCVTKFIKTLLSLVSFVYIFCNFQLMYFLLDGAWGQSSFKTFDGIFWFSL